MEESLVKGQRQYAFWATNREQLVASYPDAYVAVDEVHVVDVDTDLAALGDRLRQEGHDLAELLIEHTSVLPIVS
jgi:hypothetical protein